MEEKNAALDWLELMAGRGIGALAQKMQRQGGKKLFITGRQGIEHYPQSGVVAPQVVLDMLAVMPDFAENQYYYAKNQQTLVFKVILDDMPDSVLFIFWQQTENEDIAPLSGMLESARLALKWYLRGHKAFAKRLHEQRAAFFEGVFVKHNISVESMLAEQGIELHQDRKYAVMLMDMGTDMPLIPPADFRAKLLQFSQRYQTDLIYPLEWNGIYLVILSGLYVQQELGILSLKKRQELFARWQQLFSEVYKVVVSIGVGGDYPLAELHRSYQEARIALTFRQIKGERGFVQEFSGMGIFKELFTCDKARMVEFCRQTLDKLLAYDHDCDAGLQITLRTLLDTNFNYKLTAEKLFVHVNTVRYRCEKIAQLLEIDLNHPDTRFNLYAAIRVGDVLKALNLLQPGYVGNLSSHKSNGSHGTQTMF
ncbi:MAG: hypothetical protein E7201_00240 [Selenomonas ruminantium]|uniref:PucR C-terminal helix-turn-helix domain-containing protein n=1 Tax=Selenomonas ruminantium TaxID=971 RepID=A0A927ZWG8_SELRU|nr:hypothetical protein [Selenomonas ruminantium]